MKTISVIVQRGLYGDIAEFTLMLVDDATRLPLDTAERLPEAMKRANELRREYRASRITLEVE